MRHGSPMAVAEERGGETALLAWVARTRPCSAWARRARRGTVLQAQRGAHARRWGRLKGPNMARGAVNSLFKNQQIN